MTARASRAHVRQSAALKPKRPPLRETAEGETINAGGVFKTGECSEARRTKPDLIPERLLTSNPPVGLV